MMNIAIVVVAYNRVDSVKALLNSLNQAYYDQDVPLIISVDKSDTDAVEKFADSFVWKFGEKRVVKFTQNQGLKSHILGIGKYTEEYDALIVLEDDLIVSPCFFNYAKSTMVKYSDCQEIAGISLYNFHFNNYMALPFSPQKDEYDVYMMQIAQSWGQIWMKRQWKEFMDWYNNNNDEFGLQPHLPWNICMWGKNSWLKYHNKYCIENNKFFVYPYVSLTTNSGAAGMHSKMPTNLTQVSVQLGNKHNYYLPDYHNATKYDGFYENISLKDIFHLDGDLCVDLYGLKKNNTGSRYLLTTEHLDYKILQSYGLQYYPIEENVLKQVSGNSIYLYDTSVNVKNTLPDNTFDLLNFYFKIRGIYTLIKRKGIVKILGGLLKVFTRKY